MLNNSFELRLNKLKTILRTFRTISSVVANFIQSGPRLKYATHVVTVENYTQFTDAQIEKVVIWYADSELAWLCHPPSAYSAANQDQLFSMPYFLKVRESWHIVVI